MISILPIFSGLPQHSGISLPGRQRGVSVITGIFLLLLMSVLAAVIANVVSTAHVNMAADIGGARAYQAARAGIEWGMYQLDPNAASSTLPTCATASGTLTTIPNHSVVVSCVPYPSDSAVYQEGSRQIRIFQITATATALGVKAPGIERQVVVTIEKCRDSAITVAPFEC